MLDWIACIHLCTADDGNVGVAGVVRINHNKCRANECLRLASECNRSYKRWLINRITVSTVKLPWDTTIQLNSCPPKSYTILVTLDLYSSFTRKNGTTRGKRHFHGKKIYLVEVFARTLMDIGTHDVWVILASLECICSSVAVIGSHCKLVNNCIS